MSQYFYPQSSSGAIKSKQYDLHDSLLFSTVIHESSLHLLDYKPNRIQNPNMRLLKHLLQRFQPPRWSTLLATVFYLLFVLFILNLSFPLRSTAVYYSLANNNNNNGHNNGNSSDFGNNAVVRFTTDRKQVTTRQMIELKEAFFR